MAKLVKMVMEKNFDPVRQLITPCSWLGDHVALTMDSGFRTLSCPRTLEAQIIIFSFSKKECESLAMQMVAMDLNTAEEKQMIEAVFTRCEDQWGPIADGGSGACWTQPQRCHELQSCSADYHSAVPSTSYQ